jgi:3-hydroxymyristoyl/3-hydroxydecanoyl-(acyl carrier protein) dehydratase
MIPITEILEILPHRYPFLLVDRVLEVVEGMAQVGAVMLLSSIPDRKSKLIYFTGINGARFRQPIVPGDQIRYELEVLRLKSRVCRMRGTASVDGKLAAEAEILSAMVDAPGKGVR